MKLVKFWLPVFVWCGLIFWLSSIPNLETNLGFWDTILRKIAHIAEYFILTMLLYRAFKNSFSLKSFSLIFWPVILSLIYAISDEIHQLFVPTREGSLQDVLINSGGICLFLILLKIGKYKPGLFFCF
ncbi:MAG: VanZ family protein [Candidatus Omnitrophica bacterium]|nr:VanZ family protein [Candidatus Omnitrophota bacterium]